MIEKIYDYLLKNFGLLGGFEWTLILGMTAVGVSTAWIALRWIYQQRLEEQQKLLELRKTTVDEYRERASNLESDRGQLQQALDAAEANLDTLGAQAAQLVQHRQDLAQALRQVAARALNLERALAYAEAVRVLHLLFDNVRSSVSLYIGMEIDQQIPNAPSGFVLFDECERIADSLRTVPALADALIPNPGNPSGTTSFPAEALTFPIVQLQRQINELYSKVTHPIERALNMALLSQ